MFFPPSLLRMQKTKGMVLSDVSLCATVRDEIENPAGGIERFVRAILPHVSEGIILDTGSVDGTREMLDELKKEFSNLRVYDSSFTDYASARNLSLSFISTPWALVLDVDELIVKDGISRLSKDLRTNKKAFNIDIYEVDINLREIYGHNPRLFRTDCGFFFKNDYSGKNEHLYSPEYERADALLDTQKARGVRILHFVPQNVKQARRAKMDEWYSQSSEEWVSPPSTRPSYKLWKAYNPRRDEFF